MVPLVQTGTTLLGIPAGSGGVNSTLDGRAFNYDPAGTRNPKAPRPNVLQGTSSTYWQVQDVIRIRGLAGQYNLPSGSAGYHKVNGLPIVDITTGITGATVTQANPGAMSYRGADTGAKLMAYTFDDGPYNNASIATRNTGSVGDEAVTQDLLDLLSPYGHHVTFFTNGTKIRATNDADTDTLWNIASAGHELGDHTYDHTTDLNTHYADQIRSELIEDRLMERWVIGVKHGSAAGQPSAPYFRPPGGAGVGYTDRSIIDANYDYDPNKPSKPGHYNDASFWNTVGETGYTTIAWGPSPSDPGETPGLSVSGQAQKIADYLENPIHLHSGDIVLLHNGREHTVLALQKVLPFLQKNGWSLGKVSDVHPVAADSNVDNSNP